MVIILSVWGPAKETLYRMSDSFVSQCRMHKPSAVTRICRKEHRSLHNSIRAEDTLHQVTTACPKTNTKCIKPTADFQIACSRRTTNRVGGRHRVSAMNKGGLDSLWLMPTWSSLDTRTCCPPRFKDVQGELCPDHQDQRVEHKHLGGGWWEQDRSFT